jgi:hypothetical protein
VIDAARHTARQQRSAHNDATGRVVARAITGDMGSPTSP